MTAYDIIMKKRRGEALSDKEIKWFTEGYVKGDIPDYQMSALLMAICFKGMNADETAALTITMINSGYTYHPADELGNICIDKHSTGGVGDKTTLITAPICAACGVYVPKMSGRGLGHTGGTIDKLEAIPGFDTAISHDRFIEIVRENGFAVAGQTETLVPADKKIYDLRNATATVDSIPLISSSIMSKKLATGADGIVLDVKVGDGAFMKNLPDAEALAASMLEAGRLNGVKCTAVITDMDKPLGRAVGNSVEVIEAAEALKGNCPADLYEISITLAAEMIFLAGKGSYMDCRVMAEKAAASGKAFETFERTVALQRGDPNALSDYSLMGEARQKIVVKSRSSGYINKISCEKTGLISLNLGAGRRFKGDRIDPAAGIVFEKTVGEYVNKGDVLGTLMTSADCDISALAADFENVFSFGENAPEKRPPVIKIIRECSG